MIVRVGEVVAVYPEGKVQVVYNDMQSASRPLPVLSNNEYLMPKVGDRVLCLHMDEVQSKGFCLGTYYSAKNIPKTNEGYRKDVDTESYISCVNNELTINANNIKLVCSDGEIYVSQLIQRIERIEDILELPHTI